MHKRLTYTNEGKKQVIEYRNNFIIAQQTFKYIKLKTPHSIFIMYFSTQKKIQTSLGWVGSGGGCLITKF